MFFETLISQENINEGLEVTEENLIGPNAYKVFEKLRREKKNKAKDEDKEDFLALHTGRTCSQLSKGCHTSGKIEKTLESNPGPCIIYQNHTSE